MKASDALGGLALRTVGQTAFLEDSNGVMSVDVKWFSRRADVSPLAVAQFIADAVNAYDRSKQ
jgi:hypothetical protein